MNSFDTKFSCFTLSPRQHHSFFKYWNKKLNPSFLFNRRSPIMTFRKQTKPADWRLFSSFVFAAAATCWILGCSYYFLLGLDHKTRWKYRMRHLTCLKKKLEGMTYAESKLSMNIHSRKQFRALKVRSPSGKRNCDSYVFMDGHLSRVNDDSHWFSVMQIFYQSDEKITRVHPCDIQQFITVRLGRINTWYTALHKIKKAEPFNRQTTIS